MSSAEPYSPPSDPQSQWEALEHRVHRLVEAVTRLQCANAELAGENSDLKKHLKDLETSGNGVAKDLEALGRKYEEAMGDLRQVQSNLQKIEALAVQLKLDETASSLEKTP